MREKADKQQRPGAPTEACQGVEPQEPDVSFLGIDFEAATYARASVCQLGICVVRHGRVMATHSWLVRPPHNEYMACTSWVHKIYPEDTELAPDFPEVWQEVAPLLKESPVLVAHNAPYDISCLREEFALNGMVRPKLSYYCTLRASQKLYPELLRHRLHRLCAHFGIHHGKHHRADNDAEMCARLFLREMKDYGATTLQRMDALCGERLK